MEDRIVNYVKRPLQHFFHIMLSDRPLFAPTVRWSAPMRSDKLNEAAGGRARCLFRTPTLQRSFCACVEGKLGPLAASNH